MPYKSKKDKNASTEIFYILSRNQHSKATYTNETDEDKTHEVRQLKNLLSIIYTKIIERFPSISHAFRFFDTDYNQRVSFNEFV